MRARKLKAIRNEARGTWVFFPVINGKRTTRKLGTLKELTQELADRKAAEMMLSLKLRAERIAPTVQLVVKQYREDWLPKLRHSSQRVRELWINKHILPRWGEQLITELHPRPVQLWLESLPLAPKTRGHLRDILRTLVEYAIWAELMPNVVNPISHVRLTGSSKRRKQPRSLTVEEFQILSKHLREPFKSMALLQLCLGLRVSEMLAIRWKDVDWLGSNLNIEHGIVNQQLDSVKTKGSRKVMRLDPAIRSILSAWKRQTEFNGLDDWLFPSPVKLGRLPYSYTGYWRALQTASKSAGLGRLGTHSFRHSYRSWLDSLGTSITVQQKLMRHSDIRTTIDGYGEAPTDEMHRASSQIANLALNFDSKVIPAAASH